MSAMNVDSQPATSWRCSSVVFPIVLLLAAPTIAVCAAGNGSARAPTSPVLGEQEEGGGITPTQAVGWPGFECRLLNTGCPAGFLRNPDFSYAGCTSLPFGCVGACTSCGGSTSAGHFCQQSEAGTCHFFLPAAYVNCGIRTDHDDCFYSANAPQGEVQTPNGCYCQGARIVVPGACRSAECTP